jgi:hypothetical protein
MVENLAQFIRRQKRKIFHRPHIEHYDARGGGGREQENGTGVRVIAPQK